MGLFRMNSFLRGVAISLFAVVVGCASGGKPASVQAVPAAEDPATIARTDAAECVKRVANVAQPAKLLEEFPESRRQAWHAAQAAGNAEGEWLMAQCALYGVGQNVDGESAGRLMRRSADHGFGPAMTELGVLFHRNGASADAAEWFRRGAMTGDPDAMVEPAIMVAGGQTPPDMARGIGGAGSATAPSPTTNPTNDAEAFRLCKLGAERGGIRAMLYVALMYDQGRGVPQDVAEALAWYRKAADAGSAVGMYNVGLFYDRGRGMAPDLAEGYAGFAKPPTRGRWIRC